MSFYYSLKVNQNKNELLNNLETDYVEKDIYNIPSIDIQNNIMRYTNTESVDQTIYMNRHICGESFKYPSKESTSVPDMSNYRYLLKDGTSFRYVKERPFEDTYEDLTHFISDNGNNIINHRDIRNISIPASRQEVNVYEYGSTYNCYSFPFGGISKSYSYFYSVRPDGTYEILNPFNNSDIIIDYLEGNLYKLDSSSFDMVYGVFNVEPINVIPKGDLVLTSNVSDFYSLENISEKQVVNLFRISDNTLGLTLAVNAFVQLLSNSINIDGVCYESGTTIYLKKDVIYSLSESYDTPLSTDFLELTNELLGVSTGIDRLLESTQINLKDVVYNNRWDNFLLVYSEVEKNTYNKVRPLILKIPTIYSNNMATS